MELFSLELTPLPGTTMRQDAFGNFRQTPEEAGEPIIAEGRSGIITQDVDGKLCLYRLRPNGVAGWALDYKGHDYEFIRTVKPEELGEEEETIHEPPTEWA